MNQYTFHITPYDLAFLAVLFIGLTFIVQLWFAKRINRIANRFLALSLFVVVLRVAWILGIDIRLSAWYPHWSWLVPQLSLALGPLLYFYVRKITRPESKFRWKNTLHFSPLILEMGVFVLENLASMKTSVPAYYTLLFERLNPVVQLLAFISVMGYLFGCYQLIENFYRRLKFNQGDRYRRELHWLQNLTKGFALIWLLWVPLTAINYFYYHHPLSAHAYYPIYLLLASVLIWMAASALFKPETGVFGATIPSLKLSLPEELKQKGTWLKQAMKTNCYYRDPELSLNTLAETLAVQPRELSRIINTGLKKNFNDFINEYRVADAAAKMQEPAYDHITLLGIAFESGFNSKSTFNRIFKQTTGKSPVEYKNYLKKERPSHDLGREIAFKNLVVR